MEMSQNRIFKNSFLWVSTGKKVALGSIAQSATNETVYKHAFPENFLRQILNFIN